MHNACTCIIGESFAASTTDQSIIDERIKEIIEMEDLDIIADLWVHNGTTSSHYDAFWDQCDCFLNEHTGCFTMKFMIQQRQWRQSHPDANYAVVCFRYMRKFAQKLCFFLCSFICLDDKHKIKIGEPGYPLASAVRGKKVSVRSDETLAVGDHDFIKFSIVPSVIFAIDIPDEISESWYKGNT